MMASLEAEPGTAVGPEPPRMLVRITFGEESMGFVRWGVFYLQAMKALPF
jgi:hypothetical protein